jgi:predicted nucleotidyltransferase
MNREQLTSMLAAIPELRIVILFGSMAEGRERANSDIDLAVAADRPLSAQEKLSLMDTIGAQVGRPGDLIDLRTAGEPLLGKILEKGIQLVVRDRPHLAELIKRHLYDSEDFLPYRRRILEQRRQAWVG